MEIEVILLGIGFFLSFVLLVLLIVLATQKTDKRLPPRSRIKGDLKKIKEQIKTSKEE